MRYIFNEIFISGCVRNYAFSTPAHGKNGRCGAAKMAQIPPNPPFLKGSCEKFEICPLTLLSPARGEGKHIEI